MIMLDDVMKSMIKDSLAELHTTLRCKVVNTSPLTIQPISIKKYVSGDQEYPLILTAKKLRGITLEVNDIVIVAFDKKELTDAVILGVIE